MTNSKYEFTDEQHPTNLSLHRIRALRRSDDVRLAQIARFTQRRQVLHRIVPTPRPRGDVVNVKLNARIGCRGRPASRASELVALQDGVAHSVVDSAWRNISRVSNRDGFGLISDVKSERFECRSEAAKPVGVGLCADLGMRPVEVAISRLMSNGVPDGFYVVEQVCFWDVDRTPSRWKSGFHNSVRPAPEAARKSCGVELTRGVVFADSWRFPKSIRNGHKVVQQVGLGDVAVVSFKDIFHSTSLQQCTGLQRERTRPELLAFADMCDARIATWKPRDRPPLPIEGEQ